MLVGIVTRYYRCEATLLACRIAAAAMSYGGDIAFYTEQDRAVGVDAKYDGHLTLARKKAFQDWAQPCSHLIWLEPPLLKDVHWANEVHKHTVIVPDWHHLYSGQRKVLHAAGSVICTSRAAADFLIRRWKVPRCMPAGWDPGLTPTRKTGPLDPAKPRLFYPLEQVTPANQPTMLHMLAKVLEATQASLTIAYVPSRVDSQTRHTLQCLERRFKDRVKLLRSIPLCKLPLQAAVHDLTLWPSRADNAALGALTSAYVGTPVLAFNVPPVNEFVHASTLVPCNHREGVVREPTAVLNYRDYGAYLNQLVTEPAALAQAYVDNTYLLQERSKNFAKAWALVFEN